MEKMFKNPPQIHKGTDFWMLNDELRDDEIRRQIAEFHDKGMGAFIARTYVGLRTDYPGPKRKHQFRVMLEEATKYGMRVTLQAMRMPAGFSESTIDETLDVLECATKEFCSTFLCGISVKISRYFCNLIRQIPYSPVGSSALTA